MFEFKVTNLAKLLGVHRNTVSNWIKTGKLKAQPTVGKRYLVTKRDLEVFFKTSGLEIPTEFIELARPKANKPKRTATIGTTAQKTLSHAVPPKSSKRIHSKHRESIMHEKAVGSVMVVGGGIAGIQASLDLADSGFFVYLVEKSPGIGGAMAQLDKTFPTNDCAM